MSEPQTTVIVQRYLDDLAKDSPAESAIRGLLERAVRRLHVLCAALLHRSYPRLTHPPLNLQTEELLSAVTERLLKALQGFGRKRCANSSLWLTSTCAGN